MSADIAARRRQVRLPPNRQREFDGLIGNLLVNTDKYAGTFSIVQYATDGTTVLMEVLGTHGERLAHYTLTQFGRTGCAGSMLRHRPPAHEACVGCLRGGWRAHQQRFRCTPG